MTQSIIKRIISLYSRSPRIALLMSGQGTNVEAILKARHRYPNLNFVSILTDRKASNALNLSREFGLHCHCLEGRITSNKEREDYFRNMAERLQSLQIDTLIYAGFMKISTPSFVQAFPGINIHPSDLTLLDPTGRPKYVGLDVISKAVAAGEKYIASTAHVVDCEVDCGQPIMVSSPVYFTPEEAQNTSVLQEKLKTSSENLLLPRVLELLAQGKLDETQLPLKLRPADFVKEFI